MPPGAHPLGSPAVDENIAPDFTVIPTLTIATFNVGLLRVRLGGGPTIFCNPALVNERLPFVGQALLQLDADVLALQEVYEEAHVRLICEALSGKYPHVARRVRRHLAPWKCNNGLVLLSRYPLLDVELHVHRHAALLEHMMGSKCFLTAVVDAPLGRVFVANTHLTAGGASHPEKVDGIRERELEEVRESCLGSGCAITIVLGDINAGPEASPDNYRYLLERGFDDAIVASDDVAASKAYVTWDNQNALNKRGPHAHCPPQRCDHIFLNRGSQLVVQERHRVLTEPVVPISKGEQVTISDHYGLLVKLAGQSQVKHV